MLAPSSSSAIARAVEGINDGCGNGWVYLLFAFCGVALGAINTAWGDRPRLSHGDELPWDGVAVFVMGLVWGMGLGCRSPTHTGPLWAHTGNVDLLYALGI